MALRLLNNVAHFVAVGSGVDVPSLNVYAKRLAKDPGKLRGVGLSILRQEYLMSVRPISSAVLVEVLVLRITTIKTENANVDFLRAGN